MNFIKKYRFELIALLILGGLALFVFSNFGILLIKGDSMSPTYQNNEVLILKKSKESLTNQLVVFEPEKSWGLDDSDKFIKRIIATEGDVVEIKNREILVNGKTIEHGKKVCSREEKLPFTLKSGELIVLGDNIFNSHDSIHAYCNNKEHIVTEDSVLMSGTEAFVLKRRVLND